MTAEQRLDLAAILAALVALNLVLATGLGAWLAGGIQILVATLAVVVARRRGYGSDELGLARSTAVAGLRLGALVSAAIVVGVGAAAAIPATAEFFADDRFVDLGVAEFAYETVFRIPLVTALTEELLFRSVLLAVLLRVTSTARAIIGSSLLFGLWHIFFTLGDLGGNDTTDDLAGWEVAAGVFGVVLATSTAGAVFAWLRLRSGSVIAAWLVHITINGASFTAGAVLA